MDTLIQDHTPLGLGLPYSSKAMEDREIGLLSHVSLHSNLEYTYLNQQTQGLSRTNSQYSVGSVSSPTPSSHSIGRTGSQTSTSTCNSTSEFSSCVSSPEAERHVFVQRHSSTILPTPQRFNSESQKRKQVKISVCVFVTVTLQKAAVITTST